MIKLNKDVRKMLKEAERKPTSDVRDYNRFKLRIDGANYNLYLLDGNKPIVTFKWESVQDMFILCLYQIKMTLAIYLYDELEVEKHYNSLLKGQRFTDYKELYSAIQSR